jgi:sensor histidine kinase YesM
MLYIISRFVFSSAYHIHALKRPNDIWLRTIFLPLVILVVNMLFLADSHFSLTAYLIWSGIGIAYGLLMWEVSVRWLLYVRKRYTSIEQTRRRVLITFAGYLVITSTLQALLVWLSDVTRTNTIPITTAVYGKLIAVGFFSVLIMGAIFEIIYYFQKYREAVQESEAIKQTGLQNQYNTLKNQVNPHFLFNALNSLSALISEDREKAGLFVDELSSVYRYLLQAGQRPLVTLGDEIIFLHGYRFLLDTRFGSALQWKITVDAQFMDYWLPPLTFQTLIENALRHNSLLPHQPLTLSISTSREGVLQIANNIQRKKAAVLPKQGGLAVLSHRLQSLGLSVPIIEDNGEQFAVHLSLVKKEQIQDLTPVTNSMTS